MNPLSTKSSATMYVIIVGFLLHAVDGTDRSTHLHDSGTRWRKHLQSPRPTLFKELTSPDRMDSIDVDYGERHPFDRWRRLDQLGRFDASYNATAMYEPLRIKFITDPIDSLRGSSSNADATIDTIINDVLPAMASVWSGRLSVVPTEGTIEVSNQDCFGYFGNDISSSHVVADADLTIIVSAKDYLPDGRGSESLVCQNATLALATVCALDQFDRPVLGFINFCINHVNRRAQVTSNGENEHSNIFSLGETEALEAVNGAQGDNYVADTTLVAVHEVGHVLGMDFSLFIYFRNASTGEPLTPRPFTPRDVTCDDGSSEYTYFPSTNTLQEGTTSRGRVYYNVVTPRVQTVIRNQLNCQSIAGARLENQDTGPGCAGSHWDERLAYSELMGPVFSGTYDVLSPLTLALMEDSGWYKVNYTNAQLSPFGHGLGCDFVNGDCIVNDQVPDYDKGVFCSNPSVFGSNGLIVPDQILCDPTHVEFTLCDLFDTSQVPQSFAESFPSDSIRYFSDPNLASLDAQMDYCPVASLSVGVDCTSSDTTQNPYYSGETYGPGSRCINAFLNSYRQAACLSLTCDESTRTLVVNGKTCEYDFQQISIGTLGYGDGTFECPRLATVCPQFFCLSNCAGRGICDWEAKPPRCNCFDANDTSVDCTNNPMPTPGTAPATARVQLASGSVTSSVHVCISVLAFLVTYLVS